MAIKARDFIAKLPEQEQRAIKARSRKLLLEELTLSPIREARRDLRSNSPVSLALSSLPSRRSSGRPICI